MISEDRYLEEVETQRSIRNHYNDRIAEHVKCVLTSANTTHLELLNDKDPELFEFIRERMNSIANQKHNTFLQDVHTNLIQVGEYLENILERSSGDGNILDAENALEILNDIVQLPNQPCNGCREFICICYTR